MDDHKWAFFAWESFVYRNGHLNDVLCHIDYHWDAVHDIKVDDDDNLRDFQGVKDLDELRTLVVENRIIKKDSFIAAAIMRGRFSRVNFHCLQEPMNDGFYEKFLSKFNTTQQMYENVETLAADPSNIGAVLDIDIDMFNRSDMWCEGDLWADSEVLDYFSVLREVIRRSQMITVAMSFCFSGDSSDTRHLTNLVLNEINRHRRS